MRTGVSVSYWPVQKGLSQPAEIEAGVASVLEDVLSYCEKTGVAGRTLTVKIKYADFQIVTRSHTSLVPLDGRTALERISLDLTSSSPQLALGL